MCTYITETAKVAGSAKGANARANHKCLELRRAAAMGISSVVFALSKSGYAQPPVDFKAVPGECDDVGQGSR